MKKIPACIIFAILVLVLAACQSKLTNNPDSGNSFKNIAIITGSVYDKVIEEKFPEASVLYYNSVSEAILALKTGRADAYLDDEPLMRTALARETGLTILDDPVCVNDYGIVVAKGSGVLFDDLNKFISAIKDDGTYDDMISRWTDAENPPDMPTINPSVENGVIIFGTSGDVERFSYYKNGELTGFDVELARRFAAHQGMKLEILVMDFGALVPSVVSGKIDFAAAAITITEERKRTVDFSEPYFSPNATLCVLDDALDASQVHGTTAFLVDLKQSFVQNLIVEKRWWLIVSGLGVTMNISFFAFVFATLIGFLVCFLVTRESKLPNAAGRIYIAVLRGTPIVVLLMLVYYVAFAKVNINTVLVAILAYGLSSGANIGEIFHSAMRTVLKGQIEAARSMGFSRSGTFFTVTLPQSARAALPLYKAEFISLVKATSVVGYIAIIDLTKAGDIIRSRTYDAFFPLLIVTLIYLAVTGVIVLLFDQIIRMTDKRAGRAAR